MTSRLRTLAYRPKPQHKPNPALVILGLLCVGFGAVVMISSPKQTYETSNFCRVAVSSTVTP